MTLLLSLVFLGLVLKDYYLLVFALAYNLCFNLYGCNLRANLNALFVSRQYYGEFNRFARLFAELFNLYKVAYASLILLSAVLEYCVHSENTSSNQSRRTLGRCKGTLIKALSERLVIKFIIKAGG